MQALLSLEQCRPFKRPRHGNAAQSSNDSSQGRMVRSRLTTSAPDDSPMADADAAVTSNGMHADNRLAHASLQSGTDPQQLNGFAAHNALSGNSKQQADDTASNTVDAAGFASHENNGNGIAANGAARQQSISAAANGVEANGKQKGVPALKRMSWMEPETAQANGHSNGQLNGHANGQPSANGQSNGDIDGTGAHSVSWNDYTCSMVTVSVQPSLVMLYCLHACSLLWRRAACPYRAWSCCDLRASRIWYSTSPHQSSNTAIMLV